MESFRLTRTELLKLSPSQSGEDTTETGVRKVRNADPNHGSERVPPVRAHARFGHAGQAKGPGTVLQACLPACLLAC
jgi:hypothetical protein